MGGLVDERYGVSAPADTEIYRRIYTRAGGVVWRLGPGRVLLHRMGVPPETAAMELAGRVAFVWIALDEQGTIAQIIERLTDAGLAIEPDAAAAGDALGSRSDPGAAALVADLQLLVDAGVVQIDGEGLTRRDRGDL